jgi:HSP20 family molecular chaperone IbpA
MPFQRTSTAPAPPHGGPPREARAQPSGRPDTGEASGPADERRGPGWNPAAHLHTADARLTFTVELSGIATDRVRVAVERDVLTVHGTRPPPSTRSADTGGRPEEPHEDEFVYRFALPAGVDPASILAEYAGGILAVHVPNPARFRRTVIPITNAAEPSDRVPDAARVEAEGGTAARARRDPAFVDGPSRSARAIW